MRTYSCAFRVGTPMHALSTGTPMRVFGTRTLAALLPQLVQISGWHGDADFLLMLVQLVDLYDILSSLVVQYALAVALFQQTIMCKYGLLYGWCHTCCHICHCG